MNRSAPIARPTARILLTNEQGRVLLFSAEARRVSTDGDGGRVWFTPGGRVDDGETLAEAAAREVREETGLTAAPSELGPVVARTAGVWTAADGTRFQATDSFFHLPTTALTVETSGFEQLERDVITGHRWWSADELDSTTDTVWPSCLAALLRRLSTGERITRPIRLPWHHDD